jgi:hypothetical protein
MGWPESVSNTCAVQLVVMPGLYGPPEQVTVTLVWRETTVMASELLVLVLWTLSVGAYAAVIVCGVVPDDAV